MLRAIALISTVFAIAASAETAIPHTPAGQVLQAWLDAYNSGDRSRVEAFVRNFDPKGSPDRIMSFHNDNGKIEFAGIEKADSTHIKFKIRQQANDNPAVGQLEVTGDNPVHIQSMNFMGLKHVSADNSR